MSPAATLVYHAIAVIGATPITAMSDHDIRAQEFDIELFDDGTVRVVGLLSSEDRERLELTHVDTGTLIDGWAVWIPKEVPDAS